MSVVTNCWEFEKMNFSAGENHIKISDRIKDSKSAAEYIWWNFENPEEFFTVAMLCDVLHRNCKSVTLELPYVPFSRQDRATTFSQPFSLYIFCTLLKTLPIQELVITDVHSDVFFDLMKDCDFQIEHIKQEDAFDITTFDVKNDKLQYDCIISPDKGAVNKAKKIADHFKVPLICATKVRDPLTGQLSSPTIDFGDLKPKRALIPDDLLDAGGTFIQLADVIKQQFPDIVLDLYVTHGIFSRGREELDKRFDKIYVYNDMSKENK